MFVLHLDPKHASSLAEILARATRMRVTQVANNMAVEANHVYVIPPAKNMVFANGLLQLAPRTALLLGVSKSF